jgi:ADP-ribose pyrophosphatase YjhB (NUDIX family)
MSSSKITIWLETWFLYLQGEEIFEAAIREVKEETGVSILIHSM